MAFTPVVTTLFAFMGTISLICFIYLIHIGVDRLRVGSRDRPR